MIKSPVDGVVLSYPVRLHQVLTAGSPVATVGVTDRLEVRAEILSDDLAGVSTGQKATVTSPVLGDRVLSGSVKQIYPTAVEKQSALGVMQTRVPVIIALDSPGNLKPGYEVTVSIETGTSADIVILPVESVRTAADGHKEVMVVAGGRVSYRQVRTGVSDGKYIEIKDAPLAIPTGSAYQYKPLCNVVWTKMVSGTIINVMNI
ncbi:MAG: efflux RND transporter periplasmic adaptor subunit [Bacillota bacterium]